MSPLFKCHSCGALENSALTPGSWCNPPDGMTCSECSTGKWHGLFTKVNIEEAGYEPEPDSSVRVFWRKKV